MPRPKLSEMTLREKIGQTAMPGPAEVRKGVQRCGGYDKYFIENPFAGLYVDASMVKPDGEKFSSPYELSETLKKTSDSINIPLFVSADAEVGAKGIFDELHRVTSNMSVGAAGSYELAYKRAYFWARELKLCGVNWPFGPVLDMLKNFFAPAGIRCLADNADTVIKILPALIKGIQDAGMAATAKHFPGGGKGYRDSHFSAMAGVKMTWDEWYEQTGRMWEKAVEAKPDSIMMSHGPFSAVDSSFARGSIPRPASASKVVVQGVLREKLGFDGVIITDAISMRALSSAFDHDDIYIECFNAGNDVILFVHDDYIDVMEKAVLSGRVSMERLDESVERILALKEKLGLFDGVKVEPPFTEEENREFEQINYDIAKAAMTLIRNENHAIPFDPKKVKSVSIINLAPYKPFLDELDVMVKAFEKRGIKVRLFEYLKTKEELKEMAENDDIIIYACFLAQSRPQGMSFYSRPEDMSTLYHALSYGAEKSIAVSFGAPSIYYNYFETADNYINAYSSDIGTMKAFVDGIFGEFEFTGKSPVALKPEFKY